MALPADRSGISLVNTVPEDEERNHYNYEYIYNGGGVAVGDINNDGLADLYFTGNQVPDRLYLNKGELRFEDATDSALPKEEFHGWHAGVTMADVNSDGWLDIYVCRSGWYRDPAMRTNLLYMNKGDGTFTEEAAERGLADTTRSTQALFFDHDLDGDLDVYVVNEPLQTNSKLSLSQVHALVAQYRSASGRLYRNDKGHFTDITIAAGLWNLGYGLGAIASDLDHDGRTDLFVANDYLERDFLFMHQKNGTYRDEVLDRMRHISTYSMGCDAADYDNDGYTDLVVLDMVSEDHVRSKTNMGAMNPEKFWASVQGGLHHQYMFNMLHHNNGNGTFSDLGQLAGISKTDWSWAPLFADLDNDGWKDLVVTNGYKRDTRNNDFSQAMKELAKEGPITVDKMLELVPSTKIRNYLFRNNGDLTFDNVSEKWGFNDPVNSNGAAYADLDNDGDLDLAINNMEDVSQIYENTAMQQGLGHYLRIKLEGSTAASSMNARAELTTASGEQYLEFMPTRGYQSSVEHMLHFGLGKAEQAEQLGSPGWTESERVDGRARRSVIAVRHADARTPP
ncbi:MAG: CRTAC1 family protein [Flavobacteriales bacterium]|nr:CRTAC1 family protein [Flavobacteriales bacterium]